MTTQEISDAAWVAFPFTYRNNRGVAQATYIKKQTDGSGKISKRIIRYGIPEPKGNETDADYKGGDRIGWATIEITPDMVGEKIAVFTSIEIKGPGDKLKTGQIKWHNLVIRHGGISEVWTENRIIKELIDE